MKSKIVLLFAALIGMSVGTAQAQTRVVSGRVTDAISSEPVVGAEVLVPGTTIRTFVQDDGTYNIGVPAGNVVLLFRRIGYKKQQVNVTAGQSSLDVRLERDILQLEEVVVTGQATSVERRNLANDIATVSGDELEKVPAASVEQAIAGKVAGADIQQNSGAPGGGIQVTLRGVTSINATAQPLWVVDGVIVSDVAIPSNQNAVTAASGGSNPSLSQDGQVNRIVDLNPRDIESIEVLKGASASAIYGSKASNGVIIVKTKRGRKGRPQVNVSQRFGFFDLSNKLGMRKFADAAAIDAAFGNNTAAGFSNQRFDLEQALAGRNALSWESSMNISGGSEKTSYFISGLWKNDEGIMENTGFDKQSLRVNIDQQLGDRLRVSASTNLIRSLAQRGLSNNDNAGVSPYMVFPFTPNFVDLRKRPDGTFPDNPFERSNPLATLHNMKNDEEVWRFIASGRGEWDALISDHHAIKVTGVGGVDRFTQENSLLFPPELQFEDDDGLPGTALLSESNVENVNLSGNVVHTYSPTSGDFTTTTSVGVQYETRDLNIDRTTTRNILPGRGNIDAGTNVQVSQNRRRVEDFGLFAQEEVLVKNRLLLTAGFRADQSSANTKDEHLFFYPKAAGSYNFDVNSGLVQNVKLRIAYGESGNQPLFGQKFTPLRATNNIEGRLGLQVLGPIVVSEIKPERQREVETGVDATLLNGRASIEASFYHRTVSDLLLTRQLAPSSGFTQEVFNGGKMRVNGVDLAVALVPAQSATFNWVFRSTFGLNRSKITSLPVPPFIPSNAGFGVGLGAFRIEQGASATQIVGNITDANGSRQGKIGDANPDFKVSFVNDLSYKSFSLFFLLDWQKGGDIVNLTKLLFDAGANTVDYDDPDPNGTGDPKGLARLKSFGANTAVYLEDASFLKMREITLSWELPRSFVTRTWGALRSARLSISARNLFTITDYDGLDPEVSNFGNQAVGRNIDVAPFPPSRSWWFGLDLGF